MDVMIAADKRTALDATAPAHKRATPPIKKIAERIAAHERAAAAEKEMEKLDNGASMMNATIAVHERADANHGHPGVDRSGKGQALSVGMQEAVL